MTIETLRQIFSVHGLPEVIVSDNGTCFTSSEFKKFVDSNGIVHVRTAPYHAASNGLGERAVQVFKHGIRNVPGGTLNSKIARFLFRYRITPQSTTGVTPSELLMGRKLRSHFDMLYPNTKSRVVQNQLHQKEYHDRSAKSRNFNVNDPVYAYNFGSGGRWLPGIIVEKLGPISFKISLVNGRLIRRHQDHVRIRYDTHESVGDLPNESTVDKHMLSDFVIPDQTGPSTPAPEGFEPVATPRKMASTSRETLPTSPSSVTTTPMVASPPVSTPSVPVVPLQRSTRVSKPPERLILSSSSAPK